MSNSFLGIHPNVIGDLETAMALTKQTKAVKGELWPRSFYVKLL